MNRSILKPNAPLFDLLLRIVDPLVTFTAGWIAHALYLDSWDMPDRYVVALLFMSVMTAAMASASESSREIV